jgi:putative membrane protein
LRSWQHTIANAVRGGLIGTVEVVPGVSGGTVALIVGVYETIITSAGHIISGLRHVLSGLLRRQGMAAARTEFGRADWATLVPLAIGMLTALVLVARQVERFVHDEPELARGLFFGLVVAALFVPISMVGRHWRPSYVAAAAAWAAVAFLVTGLPGAELTPTTPIIFLFGAIAVSALILPGLSGSFILLTVGLYEPTLHALNTRDFGYLGVFIAGMAVGVASIIKVLQWLLEHRRYPTLAMLTGIMAGCTRALWPWQDDDRAMLAPGDNVLAVVLLAILGAAVVAVTLVIAHRVRSPRERPGAHARR